MLRITKLDTDEAKLVEILDKKKVALLNAAFGIQDAWRFVLYSYNNKDKFAVALETLIRHLCSSEYRRLDIKHISGYLNTESKSAYKLFYKELEFCPDNRALLEQAIAEHVRRDIYAMVSSKDSLLNYMRENKIAFSMKKAGISGKTNAVGYCTLHKINLSLSYILKKQCMMKDSHKMCSNYLILRVPFWHTRKGFAMLTSTSISDRERYRKS